MALVVAAAGCDDEETPYLVAAEIASIRAGDDERSFVARIETVPVEASVGRCAVVVEHRVELEAERIYLGVAYQGQQPPSEPDFPGCATAPRDVVISLDAPLARRHIITQDPPARWIPTTGEGYRRCELPTCDAATGEAPAKAACGDGTLADAVRRGDVPRRVGFSNERCELPWAVIDVDIGAGGCPATDGPNPCAGEWVRRTYWTTAGYTWDQVGASVGAGCGDITAVVPDFPLHLCEGLPPTSVNR